MNIPKAIEILTLMGTPEYRGSTESILKARQLGIEALKRCKILANNSPLWAAKPLPGETTE